MVSLDLGLAVKYEPTELSRTCRYMFCTCLSQNPNIGKCLRWSIMQNWEKEFKKWLGSERLKVFAVSQEKRAEVCVV